VTQIYINFYQIGQLQKNNLISKFFSVKQIVFGKNIKLMPMVTSKKLYEHPKKKDKVIVILGQNLSSGGGHLFTSFVCS